MKRRSTLLVLLLALVAAWPAGAAAQQSAAEMKARHQTRPGGWEILTDRVGADTTEIYFARMEPGFHVSTGPAALFYDPDTSPSGTFRVDATVHLFGPEGSEGAYGVFVGGDDLLGSYQRYTAFLLRADGSFMIRRRISTSSTETLVPWTEHPAVTELVARDGEAGSVENALSVEVRSRDVAFFVNGEELHRLDRGGLPVEGVAGVRMGADVEVHFGEFSVRALEGPAVPPGGARRR